LKNWHTFYWGGCVLLYTIKVVKGTPQMLEEIQDMPGEIFDISDEDLEEMAKVFAMTEEEYYYYWNPETVS
jgi:hypothetical protein